jgi:hypothetical protein
MKHFGELSGTSCVRLSLPRICQAEFIEAPNKCTF